MTDILIIGGGIAGLTAGITAQRLGYSSMILEKHFAPGGVCAGWYRGGCHIDSCIHWLTGTLPGTEGYALWEELGVLGEGIPVYHPPSIGVYEIDGRRLTLWCDPERLYRELLSVAPENGALLRILTRSIRALQALQIPALMPNDLAPLRRKLKLGLGLLKAVPSLLVWRKITVWEFFGRLRSPVLRRFSREYYPENYAMFNLLMQFAMMSSGNGGLPHGGSRGIIDRMTARYKALGGELRLGCTVEEIVVKNGRSTGVSASRGMFEARYVVAACDAGMFYHRLLGGRFNDSSYEKRFADPAAYPLPSSCFLAFRAEIPLDWLPENLHFEVEPFTIGATIFRHLCLRHFAWQPDFAPPGKGVLCLQLNQTDGDYSVWKKLGNDPAAYAAAKDAMAKAVESRLTGRFPELRGKLTLLDTATPLTYHTYFGATHGAWMAFLSTGKDKMLISNGVVKGLENVFLTGQWLHPPGGAPIAATNAKFTVQRIAAAEERPFL
ncbi:MAG: phytoene desaturase family protein [Christensenellales bacterium]|jgi:phytoene desaturase